MCWRSQTASLTPHKRTTMEVSWLPFVSLDRKRGVQRCFSHVFLIVAHVVAASLSTPRTTRSRTMSTRHPPAHPTPPLRSLAHVAHALAAGKFQIDMLRCLREVNVDHQQVRCLDSLCSSTQASCEVVLLASCSVSCLFSWH